MKMPPLPTRRALGALAGSLTRAPRNASRPLLSSAPPAQKRHQQTTTRVAPLPPPPPPSVPPESPNSIILPTPAQSSEHRPPPIRGHLPVPRDVFPKRKDAAKVTDAHLARTYPLSKAESAGLAPASAEAARKRALAHMRRRNLRSGIRALHARRTRRLAAAAARTAVRCAANQAAALAPERRDEVLTRPSVRLSVLRTAVTRDADAIFAAAERSRQRTERRALEKSDARRDALVQLYVAAGDFIVDEAGLQKCVDRLFTEQYHQGGMASEGAKSVWNAAGVPVRVGDLQAQMMGIARTTMDIAKPSTMLTTERQKKVSEELTGGKLVSA